MLVLLSLLMAVALGDDCCVTEHTAYETCSTNNNCDFQYEDECYYDLCAAEYEAWFVCSNTDMSGCDIDYEVWMSDCELCAQTKFDLDQCSYTEACPWTNPTPCTQASLGSCDPSQDWEIEQCQLENCYAQVEAFWSCQWANKDLGDKGCYSYGTVDDACHFEYKSKETCINSGKNNAYINAINNIVGVGTDCTYNVTAAENYDFGNIWGPTASCIEDECCTYQAAYDSCAGDDAVCCACSDESAAYSDCLLNDCADDENSVDCLMFGTCADLYYASLICEEENCGCGSYAYDCCPACATEKNDYTRCASTACPDSDLQCVADACLPEYIVQEECIANNYDGQSCFDDSIECDACACEASKNAICYKQSQCTLMDLQCYVNACPGTTADQASCESNCPASASSSTCTWSASDAAASSSALFMLFGLFASALFY